MLQSQGLRAGSGGSVYIPPNPGDYDPGIDGYFAGHMRNFVSTSLSQGYDEVYQLWLAPKAYEDSGPAKTETFAGPYTYSNLLEKNDQSRGFRNKSTGRRGVFGNIPEDTWYIPAYQELHQIFRYLRPVNGDFPQSGSYQAGNDEWYEIHNALPQYGPRRGWNAARDNVAYDVPPVPFLVNNPDFQLGGSQALEIDGLYLSSTIIDQTSNPVYSNQIGRALTHMGDGQILNPYYVLDYYNTGSSTYYLNFTAYTYNNTVFYNTNPTVYKRQVKRRTIPVSVEDVRDYYQTYEPTYFSPYSGRSTMGRFIRNEDYRYSF
ncbi:hypothetical protein SCREM2_gp116 [Synechococcus phage S-CREM2]|nr:hypothetical protein SCREM2_gp116 [Synechococcus phage S-CREM2]